MSSEMERGHPSESEVPITRRETGAEELEALAEQRRQKLEDRRREALRVKTDDERELRRQAERSDEVSARSVLEELRVNESEMREVTEEARRATETVLEDARAKTEQPRPEIVAAVIDGVRDVAAGYHELNEDAKRDAQAVGDFYLESLRKVSSGLSKYDELNVAEKQLVFKELSDAFTSVVGGVAEADRLKLVRRVMTETQRPQLVLENVGRLKLPEDQRQGLLLESARSFDGLAIVDAYPDLYADLPKEEVLTALAESYPKAALTRALGESRDCRLRVAERSLASSPRLAEKLDDFGFSEIDKYVLALRLARSEPEAFLKAFDLNQLGLKQDERAALLEEFAEASPEAFGAAVRTLRLSNEQVGEIVTRQPRHERDELLRAAGVPLKWLDQRPHGDDATDGPRDFAAETLQADAVEDLENRERLVEGAAEAERQLLLAIERAYPERVARERARAAEATDLQDDFERVGEIKLDSRNAPLMVSFAERALPACYKPLSREFGYPPGLTVEEIRNEEKLPQTWLRYGIAPGDAVTREWLAFQVDRAFGLDVVPTTVLRDGPYGLGSVQSWQLGEMSCHVSDWKDKTDRRSLEALAFFDAVTFNTDRHAGNMLVTPDGQLSAIDNGYCFSEAPELDLIISRPLDVVSGQPLSAEIISVIENFRSQPEVQEALKKAFEVAFGNDKADKMWRDFEGRIEELMSGNDETSRQPVFRVEGMETRKP